MLTGLTRWDPFRDILSLQDRLNRAFSDPMTRLASAEAVGNWFPAVDIREEPDAVVLSAELPGMNRDDIEVKVENGTITLRGEKKQEKEVNSDGAYRLERYFGSFARSFVLPTTIDADTIKATYKDGVLEVVLPKADGARPRRITILES
jgi:HSP20 family protein